MLDCWKLFEECHSECFLTKLRWISWRTLWQCQDSVEDISMWKYITFQEPESVSVTEPKSTPNSYWKAAFHAFVIETTKDETTNFKQIDEYWKSVGKMKDKSGQLKFSQLFALVKCLLSISHGNSIPEPGFSINTYFLFMLPVAVMKPL